MSVKSKLQLKEQMSFIEVLMDKLKRDLNEGMKHFESNFPV